MKKSYLLIACSTLALSSATAGWAQTSGDIEQVTVTASRISIAGYQQPTPVTVVSAEKLARDALTDIGDSMRQLPAFGASTSPNTSRGSQSVSGGSAGLNLVDLRNLGVSRTLVLYDGRRVVGSDTSGGVDINLLPANLVQRIDVVTGGASAAWGSDAVSGVVNVILNKNFTGISANIEGAINQLGTRKTAKTELSYGTDLFGDRLHLILSGHWLNSPDTVVPQQTSWYKAGQLVNNPLYTATNDQPRLIHATHVGLSQATQGGLITSGPLKGTQFLAGGVTAPFNFGNVSGSLSNGGSAVDPALIGEADDLAVPILTYTAYMHASLKLLDNLTATLELNYGHTDTDNGSASYTRQGNITIKSDNPYIPSSIVAAMTAAKITSFPLGTTNANNCNGLVDDFNTDNNCLGNLSDHVRRSLKRVVVALDGTIGDYSWNAYVQNSQVRRQTHLVQDPVIARYDLAVDAVTAPAGNAIGVGAGTIVCRSTLTDPKNGCQPLNVMGIGVASAAAIEYIAHGGPALSELNFTQNTAGISAEGQPFSLWAGPVSVALGAEYRLESVNQVADALSYARGYAAGNFQPLHAHYTTREGFAEIQVPLLKDNLVESIDFNAAGRITDYSTSGLVETWKLGMTSQVNDSIRLRTTWSADIRAPTLNDLFNSGSSSIQVVTDPFRNNVSTNIYAIGGGNPNLNPEQATTISGGVVLSPEWVPGLNVSLDWYSISIKGAIFSVAYARELSECYAGKTIFCSAIIRDSSGVITSINTSPLNAASQTTSGLDFQADYTTDFFDGTLNLSLLGNYTDETTQTALGVATDNAGSLGIDPPNSGGQPKFHANISANYSEGPWSGTVQVRTFGSARINNSWTAKDVDNNVVDPVGILDLRGSYRLGQNDRYQLYAAMDNVLNTPPPSVPSSSAAGLPYFYVATRTDIYDALGRFYRAGIRIKF